MTRATTVSKSGRPDASTNAPATAGPSDRSVSPRLWTYASRIAASSLAGSRRTLATPQFPAAPTIPATTGTTPSTGTGWEKRSTTCQSSTTLIAIKPTELKRLAARRSRPESP